MLAFPDNNEFSADDSYAFRTDVVDVAKVVWPCLLLFFRHDFVLAAIAADFEGEGVTAVLY